MDSPLLTLLTPAETGLSLARRLQALRLLKGWTRATLAERAGVTAASLKRFETTGKGSLELLLKVAHALGRLDEVGGLFTPPPARSMAELEERTRSRLPKKGRI